MNYNQLRTKIRFQHLVKMSSNVLAKFPRDDKTIIIRDLGTNHQIIRSCVKQDDDFIKVRTRR